MTAIERAALDFFLAYRTEHSEAKRRKLFALLKQHIREQREQEQPRHREAA